jgi:hypothetical protein
VSFLITWVSFLIFSIHLAGPRDLLDSNPKPTLGAGLDAIENALR